MRQIGARATRASVSISSSTSSHRFATGARDHRWCAVAECAARPRLHVVAAKAAFSARELSPIQKVARGIINGAALVLLLGVLRFNLSGIWAMLATVLGLVAIGFVAVWSVLSNTLSTLILVICRHFEVGDDIEFAGEQVQGKVIDLNFIYTTLRAADGSLVQIPNNLFLRKVLERRRGGGRGSLAHQRGSDHPASI